jgi:hypothetical protein
VLTLPAAALGHPELDADIAELVDAHAEQLGSGHRRTDGTELVSLLARLAGLLDLSPTDDIRLLIARLRATPPGTDCVLRRDLQNRTRRHPPDQPGRSCNPRPPARSTPEAPYMNPARDNEVVEEARRVPPGGARRRHG